VDFVEVVEEVVVKSPVMVVGAVVGSALVDVRVGASVVVWV
jgi:hypothetical protein